MEGTLDFALRYPFSSGAKTMLRESGVELDERIVQIGLERILKALDGKLGRSVALHESEKMDEVLSYAAARMILGSLRNHFLSNKFAVEESKRVHKYLNDESEATVTKVGQELGIETKEDGKRLVMDMGTYLRFAPRSVHYRLINREITKGMVAISKEERKRLIEEAVRKRLEQMPIVKDPPDSVKEAGKKLLDRLPKPKMPSVNAKPGDHPPCVDKLLESVRKHQNLPHTARWFLVTYLIGIGLSDEQIIGIYSNLPDYSERITAYQVEHARKRGYSVPSCATVNTYGLCVANCRIGIPIHWHTRDRPKSRGKA